MDTLFFRWMMTTLVFVVGGGLVGGLSVLAMQGVGTLIAGAWPLRRLEYRPALGIGEPKALAAETSAG
jgi:hypothetical protein